MILDKDATAYVTKKDPSSGITNEGKPYIGFCYPKTKEQIKKEQEYWIKEGNVKKAKNIKSYYNCYITLSKNNHIKIVTEIDEEFKDQNFRFKLQPSDNTISVEGIKRYFYNKEKAKKTQELFERIVKELKKFCYLKEEETYDIIAIYIMLTYLYKNFDFMPILHLNGEAGTGKSQIGKTAVKIGFNSSSTVSTTSSSFFRRIDRKRGLYFMDEKEKLEEYEKELLNGCTYEGNIHTVTEKVNEEFIDTDFHIYTPVILACINEVYGATSTRTLKIETVKPPRNHKKYEVLRLTEDRQEWRELRDDLCIWSLYYKDVKKLMQTDKEMEEFLNNRGVDTWKIILNLSKEIGSYKKIKNYVEYYYTEQLEELTDNDTNFTFIKYVHSLGKRDEINAKAIYTEFISNFLNEKQREHFNMQRAGRLMRRIGYDTKHKNKRRTQEGYVYTLNPEITKKFIENNYDTLNFEKKEEKIIEEVVV